MTVLPCVAQQFGENGRKVEYTPNILFPFAPQEATPQPEEET